MPIDHTHPEATYARVIGSLEQLHRALDRTADNPGLRDAAAVADAGHRLTRLAAELAELTGLTHDHLLPAAERTTVGELFLGSAELLAHARAADWWHGRAAEDDQQPALAAGTYL